MLRKQEQTVLQVASQEAKFLQKFLSRLGYAIPLGHAQEVIAQQHRYRDWNTFSASQEASAPHVYFNGETANENLVLWVVGKLIEDMRFIRKTKHIKTPLLFPFPFPAIELNGRSLSMIYRVEIDEDAAMLYGADDDGQHVLVNLALGDNGHTIRNVYAPTPLPATPISNHSLEIWAENSAGHVGDEEPLIVEMYRENDKGVMERRLAYLLLDEYASVADGLKAATNIKSQEKAMTVMDMFGLLDRQSPDDEPIDIFLNGKEDREGVYHFVRTPDNPDCRQILMARFLRV